MIFIQPADSQRSQVILSFSSSAWTVPSIVNFQIHFLSIFTLTRFKVIKIMLQLYCHSPAFSPNVRKRRYFSQSPAIPGLFSLTSYPRLPHKLFPSPASNHPHGPGCQKHVFTFFRILETHRCDFPLFINIV